MQRKARGRYVLIWHVLELRKLTIN